LLSLNLDYIVDLRNPYEVEKNPDYIPKGCEYISAPVLLSRPDTGVVPKDYKKFIKNAIQEDIDKAAIEFHETYNFMPYSIDAYSEIFKVLNQGKKIAFHCTAGKDRTGIAAMMIQFALGCSKESVVEEYLKTDHYRRRYNRIRLTLLKLFVRRKYLIDYFVMCAYAHENYIQLGLKAIFDKYPTVEEFLLKEYGVTKEDIDKWKEFYLEEDK
jgi:protein-tyrosine phosphatase